MSDCCPFWSPGHVTTSLLAERRKSQNSTKRDGQSNGVSGEDVYHLHIYKMTVATDNRSLLLHSPPFSLAVSCMAEPGERVAPKALRLTFTLEELRLSSADDRLQSRCVRLCFKHRFSSIVAVTFSEEIMAFMECQCLSSESDNEFEVSVDRMPNRTPDSLEIIVTLSAVGKDSRNKCTGRRR